MQTNHSVDKKGETFNMVKDTFINIRVCLYNLKNKKIY